MKIKVENISQQDKAEDEMFGKPELKAQKRRAMQILRDFCGFSEIKKRYTKLESKINEATSLIEIQRVIREIRTYMV